jgi:Transposase DDE domain group 1
MLTECNRGLFGYEVVEGRQVVAAFDGGEVTSDASGLLLGATDRAIGLTTRFAACFDDGRVQAQAQRVFGIALGYEDLIEQEQLRHDPVLANPRRQAPGEAPKLRPARRQEHTQPARARADRAFALPQDRPRRGGDRGFARRPLPRRAQDAAQARRQPGREPHRWLDADRESILQVV